MIHGNFFGQSSFATYAIAHRRNTVKVDKAMPLEILRPLGSGVQTGAGAAVLSLDLKPGQSPAVFGGGAVGLSALLGARAVAEGLVIVAKYNTDRHAHATEQGAQHTSAPPAPA